MHTFLVSITLKDGYEIPCRDDKECIVSLKMQQPNMVACKRCVKALVNMNNVEELDVVALD